MKFASYIHRFIMKSGYVPLSHSNLLSSESSSALATVKRPQLSSIPMERPTWVSGHFCTIRVALSIMSSSSSTSIATVISLTLPPSTVALDLENPWTESCLSANNNRSKQLEISIEGNSSLTDSS